MIYYLLPILSFLASFLRILNIKSTKNLCKFLVGLIFLIYFVIVGLRGEGIGTDYYEYEGIFFDPSRVEPGFGFLIRISKLVYNDYRFFIIVVFALCFYLRYKLFTLISKEIAISFLALFGFWMLVYDMNGIRQGLSLSFIGFAGYYALNQKLRKYLVFCLLATSIHYSSILFLPFYWVLNSRIKKEQVLIIIVILYFLAVLDISGYLFSLTLQTSASGIFVDRISTYSGMEEYNSNTIFSFNAFHRIFIFFVIYFSVDKIPASNAIRRFLLITAFMNMAVFLLLSRFELIAVRGSLPYRYFEMVFFSYLPFISKNKHTQFWMLTLIFLYVIFQVFTTINITTDIDNTLLPYRTIFD